MREEPSARQSGTPVASESVSQTEANERVLQECAGVRLTEWKIPPPGASAPCRQEAFEIALLLEGKGDLRLDEKVVPLMKGDIYIARPNQRFRPVPHREISLTILSLRCAARLLERLFDDEMRPATRAAPGRRSAHELLMRLGPRVPSFSRAAHLGGAILQQLRRAKPAGTAAEILWIHSKILDLLGLLLRYEAADGAGDGSEKLSNPARRWGAVAELVEAMPRLDLTDLTTENLAGRLDLSVRHFTRLVRACTGTTFNRYVQNLRIKRARELLLSSDYRIIEIAQAVGYRSLSQFNLIFKRATGFPPDAFRRHHRKAST